MFDELRRAIVEGWIRPYDAREAIDAAECELEGVDDVRQLSHNQYIRRGLLAGECAMDVQRTREIGEPVRLHLIRCFDDLIPTPPPTSAPPSPDDDGDFCVRKEKLLDALRRAIDDGLDPGEARAAIDGAEDVDDVSQLPHTDDPALAALQRAIVEGLDPDEAREAIIDAEVEISGRENAALEEEFADELEKLKRYHAWLDDALEAGELVTLKLLVVRVLPADGDQLRRPVLVPKASRTLMARIAREQPTAAA